MGKTIEGVSLEFMKGVAPIMEQWARKNHPWKNQTGDAERGLIGEASSDGKKVFVTIGHTVEYGPALEKKHDGKFGVLKKTVDHFVPEIDRGLAMVLEAYFNE